MRPIKIKIRGFNSFLEEQEIDFEKLGKFGIFGIFGPTGSGKSSILDAITFALYGKIARDSSNSAKEQYININTDTARVIFEFGIKSTNEEKVYRIVREIKKDANKKTTTKQVKLIMLLPKEEVLAEKEIEFRLAVGTIIGLEYDDFIKTVVLPQGGFNDFLKMEGRDRRVILERLFNLEKYGDVLEKKIKNRVQQYEREDERISGGLASYEGITNEAFNEVDKKLNEYIKKLEDIKIKKENSDIKLELNKNIYERQLKIDELKLKLEERYKSEAFIKECKEKIERDRYSELMLPLVSDYENSLDEKIKISDELNDVNKGYKKLLADKEKIEKLYRQNEEKFNIEGKMLSEKIIKLRTLTGDWDEYIKRKAEFDVHKSKYKQLDIEHTLNLKQQSEVYRQLEEQKMILYTEKEYLKKHEIDIELRQRLIKACEFYNRLEALEESLSKLNTSDDEIHKLILELKGIINTTNDSLNQVSDKINVVKAVEDDLKNNILSDSGAARTMILKYKNLYEYIIKKGKAVNSLKNINTEFYSINNDYIKLCSQFEAKTLKLDNLKALKEKLIKSEGLFNISRDLKRGDICPVCGNVIKDIKHKTQHGDFNYKISSIEKNIKFIQEALKQELQKKSGFEGKIAVLNERKEKIIAEDNSFKLNESEAIYNFIQRLKSVLRYGRNELDEVFEVFKAGVSDNINNDTIKHIENFILNDIIRLENTAEDINRQLHENQKKHENLLEQKHEISSNLSVYTAKIKIYEDTAKNNINLKQSLKNDIDEVKNTLYTVYNDCGNNPGARLDIILKSENINKKTKIKIEECEKCIQDLEEVRYKNESKLKSSEITKKEYETMLKEESRNTRLLEKKFLEIMEQLKSPADELEYTTKQYSELEYRFNSLKGDFERISEKSIEAEKNSEILEKKAAYIDNILEDKKSKLIEIFNKYNEDQYKTAEGSSIKTDSKELYSDKTMCMEAIILKIKKSKLENNIKAELLAKINDYEEDIRQLNGALNEFQKYAGSKRVSLEEYKAVEDENSNINDDLNSIQEEVIAIREKRSEILLKLEKIEELLRKKEAVSKNLSIARELKNTVGARKFAEFMALKQLDYIASAAGERLFEISSGAYGLETAEDGTFKIRDYKNGGRLRNVKTLSGGESFVVSLSLALSLSAHIQLKGSAPLELFFLDEGFGTLDEELLEVVMDSLEKVYNDRMKVGLISHVEYLKQRVPVRLIVRAAVSGEGGSKVSIEYG